MGKATVMATEMATEMAGARGQASDETERDAASACFWSDNPGGDGRFYGEDKSRPYPAAVS